VGVALGLVTLVSWASFSIPGKRGFPLLLQGGHPLPEVLGWIADGLGRGFPPTSQIASVQIKSHQLY
jgi:hypothetical protein